MTISFAGLLNKLDGASPKPRLPQSAIMALQPSKIEPLSPLNQPPVNPKVAAELDWVLVGKPPSLSNQCRTLADVWAADVLTRG